MGKKRKNDLKLVFNDRSFKIFERGKLKLLGDKEYIDLGLNLLKRPKKSKK